MNSPFEVVSAVKIEEEDLDLFNKNVPRTSRNIPLSTEETIFTLTTEDGNFYKKMLKEDREQDTRALKVRWNDE